MRIIIATSEAIPYIKTGGLADVAGSLLEVFLRKKEQASLILPLYRAIPRAFDLHDTGAHIAVPVGDRIFSARILASDTSRHPRAYFIECDELFDRDELYGTSRGDYPDNAVRFIFFSKAVLETCIALKIQPDVIHCNDWQTALVPLYLRTTYRDAKPFRNTGTLFTVHNLGYQGQFDASEMRNIGLGPDFFTSQTLEFYGGVNFLKAGLLYADIITTVSETYAHEILDPEYSFGLDGVLKMRKDDLFGIINGIDYKAWDPSQDKLIAAPYRSSDLSGKRKCKEALLKETGLKGMSRPLLGVVSRLSHQKGLDLIYHAVGELVETGCNLVIFGKGEEYYHALFRNAAKRHRGHLSLHIGFSDPLAHMIYAGTDFFLMPSRYEPCGLGQLIAMKYGSLPIARRTGGLADTVRDYRHLRSEGTGFLFSDFTPSALQDAVKRAVCVFLDKKRMQQMMHEAMESDFSWERSAEGYRHLYRSVSKRVER